MANVQLAVAGDDTTQVILSVPGVQGPTGSSIPPSGTTNQVLYKQSNTDYDTGWSLVTSAMITNGTIVDGDINASAAIAGTKISPNFGSQNITTTGTGTAASFIPTSSSVPTNGMYLPATNTVGVATNGTGRLFIDSSGNVGIATTTPQHLCQIAGTLAVDSYNDTTKTITLRPGFEANANGGMGLVAKDHSGSAPDGLGIYGTDGVSVHTANAGTFFERFRVDTLGRLLVGTSTYAGSGRLIAAGNTGGFAGTLDITWTGSRPTAANTDIGYIRWYVDENSSSNAHYASIHASSDAASSGTGDIPGRLVFSTTADGASSPTERLRINNSGAIGLSGANFGTAGQVLVSNGSSAAPTWEQITPSAVFGWDHDNDTYGLYLPGTSIRTGALSGTVDISVQSRLRRCVINDSGVVQYHLDADDSTLKSGDWLRIVETQALDTAYTGTHSESTNSLLRVGVPAWAAGTFTRGQRVTHNGSLWECVAASTTATPAAGTVASDLSGTDGQVMVEVPAFSVRYGYINGVHTREVRLGCSDSLIAQGFQPHPAFIKTDGTYKDAFYIGAYQVTGTSPATTVSGASNRVSMTRATQRSASAARGTGWHVLSYLELAAIQTLMVTEFRDMNTQRAIGNGAQEGAVYVVNTGLSNAAGNRSQNAYTSGGAVTDYISYRGLENIYGRAWQWVDGFNVYERVVYLSNDQTAFADNTSVGYKFYAQVPSGLSSYQKELFALPDVFLPSVVTGASSTTYLADAFTTSTGWRVANVGGSSNFGTRVGAFTLALDNGSGSAGSSISARLAYAAN